MKYSNSGIGLNKRNLAFMHGREMSIHTHPYNYLTNGDGCKQPQTPLF